MTRQSLHLAVAVVRRLRRASARLKAPGRIRHGVDFVIGPRPRFARGFTLTTGDRVNIGADVTVMADVLVGDDVMISSNVAFIGDDHEFDLPNLTIQQQPRKPHARIALMGDNLIGFGAIIIGNVNIGKGAVIGSGSVVTRDVPPYMVAAGVPARVLRHRPLAKPRGD